VLEQPFVGHEIGNEFLLGLAFHPSTSKCKRHCSQTSFQECENVAYFPAAPHGTIAFFNVNLQLLEWQHRGQYLFLHVMQDFSLSRDVHVFERHIAMILDPRGLAELISMHSFGGKIFVPNQLGLDWGV
jgi:hypothetical protein